MGANSFLLEYIFFLKVCAERQTVGNKIGLSYTKRPKM